MKRTILAIILFALLPSQAAAYYVCAQVSYLDARVNRVNGSGSRLTTANQFTNQPVKNVYIYFYEQNGDCQDWNPSCGETDDSAWGAISTGTTGTACVTGVPSWADVYFGAAYTNGFGEARTPDGGTAALASTFSSTVDNIGGNLVRSWSISCPNKAVNDLLVAAISGYSDPGECPEISPSTNFSLFGSTYDLQDFYESELAFSNILASFQDMDEVMTTGDVEKNGHTQPFTAHWPNRVSGTCSGASSWNDNDFCLSSGVEYSNHTVAHETAHCIHRRAVNWQTAAISGCTGGSSFQSANTLQCATSEGWADFVAAYTYFQQSGTTVPVIFNTDTIDGLVPHDTDHGYSGTPTTNYCVANNGTTDPSMVRGNFARFWWDLYDSNNTGTSTDDRRFIGTSPYWVGRDDLSASFTQLVNVWDEFDPLINANGGAFTGLDWTNYRAYAQNNGWTIDTGGSSTLLGAINDTARANCAIFP